VLVQEGKIACTSFPLGWDVVVRDELALMQEGNLECARFHHDGILLLEMSSHFCKG
jgi:hypothetical protein